MRSGPIRVRVISVTSCRNWQRCYSTAHQSSIVRWFYASDVPKSKPEAMQYKPTKPPSTFVPFSANDSKRLEWAYNNDPDRKVLVKEDGLFHVDLDRREVAPVYWQGPVFDVRRGLWFYHNGGKPSPCSEQLGLEIESFYQKAIADDAKADPKQKHTERVYCLDSLSGKIKFSKDNRSVAWVNPDDSMTLQRLTGGTKVVRGYNDKVDEEQEGAVGADGDTVSDSPAEESLKDKFMSSLFDSEGQMESKSEDDLKHEMESEYDDTDKASTDKTRPDDSTRKVTHLLLCVHGIGQRLARKIESVNFVHDINVFRKSFKTLYNETEELQAALNPGSVLVDSKKKDEKSNKSKKDQKGDPSLLNCEVQALPVMWRDSVAFGMTQSERTVHPKGITLDDVTVEGVRAVRHIVGDVILDVFLYKQPNFKRQIIDAVKEEVNRIYKLFRENNPNVGDELKVSLIGHSLGSAICFDMLTNKDDVKDLEFEVENFYGVGSPQGLFLLLEGTSIEPEQLLINGSYYNIFHPCDPIAYRVEPLVDKEAAPCPVARIPYSKGGLNSQIQELSQFGQRITKGATSAWSTVMSSWASKTDKSVQDALKNVLESTRDAHDKFQKTLDKEDLESEESDGPELPSRVAEKLHKLNVNGRVDYGLQEGVLDISLIAALASHISYFENPDMVNLILWSLYKPDGVPLLQEDQQSNEK